MFKPALRARQAITARAQSVQMRMMSDPIVGPGTLFDVPKLLRDENVRCAMIVTSAGFVRRGLVPSFANDLMTHGITPAIFSDVPPDPDIECVRAAAAFYRSRGCEAIVAIGGGSVMDCAKVAGALAVRPGADVRDLIGTMKVRRSTPFLVAVPTTAGTGSEVTAAAVVSDPARRRKYAISDIALIPDAAVLDANLLVGLPPALTAATGMDALTHAVEAHINRFGSRAARHHAENAVRLIFEHLKASFDDGGNLLHRENMLVASFDAGVAFTNAMVGYVHALAHGIGGMYHVPHGLANAVLLPAVLDEFGPAAEPRLARLADVIGAGGASGHERAQRFIGRIRELAASMDLPDRIPELREEDIRELAAGAEAEGNPAYPVPEIWTRRRFEKVLRSVMAPSAYADSRPDAGASPTTAAAATEEPVRGGEHGAPERYAHSREDGPANSREPVHDGEASPARSGAQNKENPKDPQPTSKPEGSLRSAECAQPENPVQTEGFVPPLEGERVETGEHVLTGEHVPAGADADVRAGARRDVRSAAQRRVRERGPLLDDDGMLARPGWATSQVWEYDRARVKASALRVKEWDYYLVNDESCALALTIGDMGYAALVSAALIDFERGEAVTQSTLGVLPMGRLRLPATAAAGTTAYADKRAEMRFDVAGGLRRLEVEFRDFRDGLPLLAEVVLDGEPRDSMVIATPWLEDDQAFYYNQKIVGMRAAGVVRVGEREHWFTGGDSFGLLDWGRGVWTRDNTWFWSAAQGLQGGRRFGMNLGYGFGDTSAASENMLFVDGVAHKLGRVDFGIPVRDAAAKAIGERYDLMRPWRMTDDEGRLDLVFSPEVDRCDYLDFKAVVSDQHQVFGRFDGWVVLDDGSRFPVHALRGFAEAVHNRY